jgi:putative PIG3 family NAD(P)H quinone oxidoreductase
MTDTAQMRAVVITRPGGPEVLAIREVPRPAPGTGEVLVRVRATALNRADLLQRQGRYPAPPGAPADIPGLEFAGDIAELGPGAAQWRIGDRVFGITGGGAHAEYLVSHERLLARIPDEFSFTEAAAVPEAFITAQDALVARAELRMSERVLIHAAGSGVGLAAIQLVRAMNAVPFGTARTAEKIARAKSYGLEDGVTVGESLDVIAGAVARWTENRGMQVVLDLVGGPYLAASIAAAATLGRIVLISTMAGRAAPLPLDAILGKRLTIRGAVLRARPLEEKILATRAFADHVVPLLARGVVRPVIEAVLPIEEIAAAHERLASNTTFGKLVLSVD